MSLSNEARQNIEDLIEALEHRQSLIPIMAIGLPKYYLNVQDLMEAKLRLELEVYGVPDEQFNLVFDRVDDYYTGLGLSNPCPEVRENFNSHFLGKLATDHY